MVRYFLSHQHVIKVFATDLSAMYKLFIFIKKIFTQKTDLAVRLYKFYFIYVQVKYLSNTGLSCIPLQIHVGTIFQLFWQYRKSMNQMKIFLFCYLPDKNMP